MRRGGGGEGEGVRRGGGGKGEGVRRGGGEEGSCMQWPLGSHCS